MYTTVYTHGPVYIPGHDTVTLEDHVIVYPSANSEDGNVQSAWCMSHENRGLASSMIHAKGTLSSGDGRPRNVPPIASGELD
ncbi:hypothetical protein WN48_04775 [Eufriesea mexicana]|uniref:Uncharacterized protein n=1 Tax=Eufriesea mexicana TaxID=516756 RepID=A0A310SDN2_9HYME|nr:hypothetical protein WN48_04775 [Eufriesea mexicana]